MSEKKPRTALQLAANKAASERADKIKKNSAAFFAQYGLSARVPYPAIYAKMKKEDKSDAEIAEYLKQKQQNNAATRKAKSANKASSKASTPVSTPKANSVASTSTAATTTTTKEKSEKKAAADKAQANTGQKFRNHGLKAYPQAVSYYIAQKKAGKNDETIFEEIKARSNLQTARATTKKNNKKNNTAVAPIGMAAPTVAANKGVAKGQYVCEKCRLVANNNTRKNNTKKNNKAATSFNNSYNWYE